jgi:hypothetical protein
MKIDELIEHLQHIREELGNLSVAVECDGLKQTISLDDFEALPKERFPWWFQQMIGATPDETHVLVIDIDC